MADKRLLRHRHLIFQKFSLRQSPRSFFSAFVKLCGIQWEQIFFKARYSCNIDTMVVEEMSKDSYISRYVTWQSCIISSSTFLSNANLPQMTVTKYLGLHLDSRRTWKTYILMKRNQLSIRLRERMWLNDKNSKMSPENKILIFKAILKPMWT